MKYSDYITIQDFMPVYDMKSEGEGAWQSFIPTKQFCSVLNCAINDITTEKKTERKSIWLRGTFGTGKSHASSVIKHLLCDDYEKIENYLSSIEDANLKGKVDNLRKTKRYFPVVLKGVEGAYDIPSFSLSLQKETKRALSEAGYDDIVVKSDFEAADTWVEDHRQYTEDVITKYDELSAIASTPDKVIAKLKADDAETYIQLSNALRDSMDVQLSKVSISEWLEQMEHAIEEQGIADGLIIFWDEFTSVMDTIKSDRINVLQNIAEKSQHCNLFLFLISHRTEQQSLDNRGKDISKMSDRFDIKDYRMDELSTYVIMRHTFRINKGNSTEYELLKYVRTDKFNELLSYLSENGTEEEEKSISNLFPLHPYTAYLCSKLSNQIGSANRTVIKFMNDKNAGFPKFIEDETACDQKRLLTADWLWDFFYDEFDTDPSCSIFTNTYRTYESQVAAKTDGYLRVFKAILLLNAINSKFDSSADIKRLIPNDTNIKYMFEGDPIEEKIGEILDFLDESNIIPRNVFGDFKIQFSTYNPKEIASAKNTVQANYKNAVQFLSYNQAAKRDIVSQFMVYDHLYRRCDVQLYACEEQEAVLRSRLNKYMETKPNNLHIVLFLSITDESRDAILYRIGEFAKEFKDSILIVPEEPMGKDVEGKFIDVLANMQVAKTHFNENAASEYDKTAKKYIETWIQRLMHGNYMVYFNSERYEGKGYLGDIDDFINETLSPKIFTAGLETVKKFHGVSMTFFQDKNYPKSVINVLQAKNRDNLKNFVGDAMPAKYIFEDENGNNLVDEECNLYDSVKDGDYWISKVCKEMDKLMSKARKEYQDRFSLSTVLSPFMYKPFGFFPSKANWVAIAFALRKYKDDLFLPSTAQPVSDEKLRDMVTLLFKMWSDGDDSANSKLNLRFGSPEESKLKNLIAEVFNLKDVMNLDENKSLANAKWGVQEFCKKKAKQPLWTLKYCDNINNDLKKVVSQLIDLFEQEVPKTDRIKELTQLIETSKIDLYQLVTNTANYENGFYNFVKGLDNVQIKDEWWNDLIEEVNTLPSEVAFRKESDVQTKVLNFYIGKIQQPKPNDQEEHNGGDKDSASPYNVPSDNNDTDNGSSVHEFDPGTVEQAKTKISNTKMPNIFWQKFVMDLVEAYPESAKYISDNLE